MSMKMNGLFDVAAVNIDACTVRLLEVRKTRENAEAIEKMAVMRRGVTDEFFAAVQNGKYSDGDTWKGAE